MSLCFWCTRLDFGLRFHVFSVVCGNFFVDEILGVAVSPRRGRGREWPPLSRVRLRSAPGFAGLLDEVVRVGV